LQLAKDFRYEFDALVRPLEQRVDKLANFKVDLCVKIDKVKIELNKLKKGEVTVHIGPDAVKRSLML